MKSIVAEIKKGKPLVSDGAWGTLLQQKGMKPGECPELWNITHSDAVYNIAKSYIDAGAEIIETNSFGGNVFKLKLFGLADKVWELNKAAAEISRKAAGEKIVIGSIGPTGKLLMMGDVTEDELYNAFIVQAQALEAGGVDGLVVETMTDLEEAKIAIRACKENTKCEIICTMTFEKTRDRSYNTIMGITPSQMTQEFIGTGVSIIGANCGNGITDMVGIVEEIRKVDKNIPILIHANAGVPLYKDGHTIFPETPAQMAGFVSKLIGAGANIIGGCCGTTPEHILRIAELVKK
jgi:5-methyltetrahydrofolate--homocysteine methyltransferase